jgi:hypothetical protein
MQRLGNECRLRTLQGLRALYQDNLYFELGYTSYQKYCDQELGLARSTCLEYLRAAVALEELETTRYMFSTGNLSWQQVRAITRVATAQTERAWIEFAISETVDDLNAEVKEAVRTGRTAPRDRRLGLPNLTVKVTFELTLEEKERVHAALARVADGLAAADDVEEARGGDPRDAAHQRRALIVRWADGILSGAIPASPVAQRAATSGGQPGGAPVGTAARPTPSQTIVYTVCRECDQATVRTLEDGFVRISPDRIRELEPVSNAVHIPPLSQVEVQVVPAGQIDPPNTAGLARQVLHRDGLRCANPSCGRRENLHAHHIVFRSAGGRTSLENEVTLCDTCHALIHSGRLSVSGTPRTGYVWRREPESESTTPVDSRHHHPHLSAGTAPKLPPAGGCHR